MTKGDVTQGFGGRTRVKRLSGLLLALVLLYGALFVLFHDEPAPFVEWRIPEHPIAKAAYDYAHAIKLPDAVPDPVPFQFCRYTMLGLCFGKATRDDYFQHLCKTEAGEYVFKKVEGVEGIAIMSPRPARPTESAFRDAVSDEIPLANLTDSAFTPLSETHLADMYVRPPGRKYKFLEVLERSHETYILKRYSMSQGTGVPSVLNDPFTKEGENRMVATVVDKVSTRHQIWLRGVRRARDREFGISGADIIVYDATSGLVIAVRRDFARSVFDYRTSSPVRWDTALSCLRVHDFTTKRFISSVLAASSGN